MRQYELLRMLAFEFKRWKSRVSAPKRFETKHTKLHLGSGARMLKGWLNVDMIGSELNLDFATGKLPFLNAQFEVIVSQHVIEHLTMEDELLPLLNDCFRVLKQGGHIWLSTPDMEKVSKSYINNQCSDMITDRKERLPHWNMDGVPSQHFLNDIFHQQLEHRNLFDFELLKWCLEQSGFTQVKRIDEPSLLAEYSEIPQRNDDYQSLYVKAMKA